MKLTVKLADKIIEINCVYPKLHNFFHDYLAEDAVPDFAITTSEADIRAEEEHSESVAYPAPYLESLALHRKISEVLPLHNAMLIHGASIAYDGKGYLFTAPSGTGKSTHIRLWMDYIGKDVDIINGDKPFLSFGDTIRICGSPWAGKEDWHKNHSFPLAGICFLKRGEQNYIRKLAPAECLPLLFHQIYMPTDSVAAGCTLELTDLLLRQVPVYLLECNISEDAVRCSFEALTSLHYPK